jgi:hypothetical protein
VVGDGIVSLSARLGDRAPTLRDLLAKGLTGEAAKLAQSSKPDFALSAISLSRSSRTPTRSSASA